ncbi:MAG: hypothetical protein Q9208_000060 [Pyrenodesmia sp. 3 TL-2023]
MAATRVGKPLEAPRPYQLAPQPSRKFAMVSETYSTSRNPRQRLRQRPITRKMGAHLENIDSHLEKLDEENVTDYPTLTRTRINFTMTSTQETPSVTAYFDPHLTRFASADELIHLTSEERPLYPSPASMTPTPSTTQERPPYPSPPPTPPPRLTTSGRRSRWDWNTIPHDNEQSKKYINEINAAMAQQRNNGRLGVRLGVLRLKERALRRKARQAVEGSRAQDVPLEDLARPRDCRDLLEEISFLPTKSHLRTLIMAAANLLMLNCILLCKREEAVRSRHAMTVYQLNILLARVDLMSRDFEALKKEYQGVLLLEYRQEHEIPAGAKGSMRVVRDAWITAVKEVYEAKSKEEQKEEQKEKGKEKEKDKI